MLLSPPIHVNVYVVHLLIASLIFLFFSSQKFLWNFYMEVFLLTHFLTASKIIMYANTYLISALLSLTVLKPWSCCVALAYVIGGPLAKGTSCLVHTCHKDILIPFAVNLAAARKEQSSVGRNDFPNSDLNPCKKPIVVTCPPVNPHTAGCGERDCLALLAFSLASGSERDLEE